MLRLMTGIHTTNADNSFGVCLTPQSKLRRGSHLQCRTVTSIAAKKQTLRLWRYLGRARNSDMHERSIQGRCGIAAATVAIAYTACRCSAVTGWQVLCGARKRVHAPAAGIKAVYVPHHSLRRTGSSVVIFPFNRCLARVAAVDPHAGCRRRALRRNLNAFDCRRFWCRYPVRNGAAVGHADARGLP